MKKLFYTTLAAALLAGIATVSAADAVFDRMDTNKDGIVSKEEFDAFHKTKGEERFLKMDTDGDGMISAEEFEAKKRDLHEKIKSRLTPPSHKEETEMRLPMPPRDEVINDEFTPPEDNSRELFNETNALPDAEIMGEGIVPEPLNDYSPVLEQNTDAFRQD